MFGTGRYRALSQSLMKYSSNLIDISPEVKTAIAEKKPLVALESTIITHGMPYPENIKTAVSVENIIRKEGAVPATIAILEGRIKIGLDTKQLERLANPHTSKLKTSRRDFSYVLANKMNGGTTVSGTMVAANLVGIKIFVTGGIGGVHRKGEVTLDVSADLTELGRTPMMVISSGVKSILDIGKTLEYLETQGVSVATFGSKRDFPAFYSVKSGYNAPHNVESVHEAAKMLYVMRELKLQSGLLLAVPIPEDFSIDSAIMEEIIEEALLEAEEKKISGKEVTPFILAKVSHLTEGKSLQSNIALIQNNAKVGGRIAVEFQKLIEARTEEIGSPYPYRKAVMKPTVIGGSILDCNVTLGEDLKLDGRTVRGKIEESAGGVGRNLADALGKLAPAPPLFLSALGNDQYGRFLLESIKHIDTTGVSIDDDNRTACCSVLLDRGGECCLVVGDMNIHSTISQQKVSAHLNSILSSPLIVFDGNIPEETMEHTLEHCGRHGIPVWFEPTDISTAAKPFRTELWKHISFISPNINELQEISNFLGFGRCDEISFKDMDTLIKQLTILAAPIAQHINSVMITMGYLGVIMVSQISPNEAILNALQTKNGKVQGRYYPATKVDSVISVSGAGDCAAAAFMTGVLQGLTEPECVSLAQSAAFESLLSNSAVPKSFSLREKILHKI